MQATTVLSVPIRSVQPVKQKSPLRYLFSEVWKYSEGNRKRVVIIYSMFVIANGLSMTLIPLLTKMFVDVIQSGVTWSNINEILGLLLAISLVDPLHWLFHGPARVMERKNAFQVRARFKKYLVQGFMGLPLDWHAENHTGATIDKLEKATASLYAFASETFVPILSGVRFVVSLIMLGVYSPSSIITVIILILVTVKIVIVFDKVIMANQLILNKQENTITAEILDKLSGIMTIATLRLQDKVLKKISAAIDKPFALYLKNTKINEWKWFNVGMCGSLMGLLVMASYVLIGLYWSKPISGGTVFLLFRYLKELEEFFDRLAELYSEILMRYSKVIAVTEFTHLFKEKTEKEKCLQHDWKKLEINNLNFTYPGPKGEILHLTDTSIEVNRGESIAIVGETGAGKSTKLKLMRGLHIPQSAEVIEDGKVIKLGIQGIIGSMGLIPQKPEIFASTILENITLGEPCDPALLDLFIEMACFTNVVKRLPKGLDSVINERGVNLSGGEQQRLALARALFASRNRISILLMDEPTSSVGSPKERQIYENIRKAFPNAALVVSTHQLHLLDLFNRIYVFDKGRIVGSGTQEELLVNCPKFREICQHPELQGS